MVCPYGVIMNPIPNKKSCIAFSLVTIIFKKWARKKMMNANFVRNRQWMILYIIVLNVSMLSIYGEPFLISGLKQQQLSFNYKHRKNSWSVKLQQ